MADLWAQSEFRTEQNAERKTDPKSELTYCIPTFDWTSVKLQEQGFLVTEITSVASVGLLGTYCLRQIKVGHEMPNQKGGSKKKSHSFIDFQRLTFYAILPVCPSQSCIVETALNTSNFFHHPVVQSFQFSRINVGLQRRRTIDTNEQCS